MPMQTCPQNSHISLKRFLYVNTFFFVEFWLTFGIIYPFHKLTHAYDNRNYLLNKKITLLYLVDHLSWFHFYL